MADFSDHPLVSISLLFGICFFTYRYLLYPAFLSPLSKVPTAHFSTRFSPAWIQWLRYRGHENSAVCAAHLKYGPVILLAPDEISVNCIDNGTNTVYGKAFEKPNYWAQFAIFGHRNQLSSLDAKSHTLRRKRLARVFAKSYLQNSDDWAAILDVVVRQRLYNFLLDLATKNEPINVLYILRAPGVDAVTAYMFGLANGTNFVENTKEGIRFQKMYNATQEDTYTYNPFFYEIFGLGKWLASFNPRSSLPSKDAPITRYGDWGLTLCDAAEKTLGDQTRDGSLSPGYLPVVYCQMKSVMETEGQPFAEDIEKHLQANPEAKGLDMQTYQRLEIGSELIDNVNATNATLGTALSFAVWEMSKRSDLQAKLRSEVLKLLNLDQIFNPKTIRALEELPILNAITMETLRRHAPVPGVLPRQSPHGVSSRLGEYDGIPGGVRVTAYGYSLHRNAEVFPEPEEWRPERWIVSSDQRNEMERWFWAFGSGVRACSGDIVALHVMKAVLATIYSNFVTEVVEDDGMQQIDGTIGDSKGDKLILTFQRA